MLPAAENPDTLRLPILQVALRGGNELRREILGTGGRKAAPGMIGVLREVAKTIPAVAGAVLLHLGLLPSLLLLYQPCMPRPRSLLLPCCLPSICLASSAPAVFPMTCSVRPMLGLC